MWLLFVKSPKMVCGEMANCIGWDRTTHHQPHWMPQMYYILVGSEIKVFYDLGKRERKFCHSAAVALLRFRGTLHIGVWLHCLHVVGPTLEAENKNVQFVA